MLKLFGIIFVLVSSVALGICLAEEKKRRLKSLWELKRIITVLRGEIRYGGTPLKEAMEACAGGKRGHKGQVQQIFLEITEAIETRKNGSFYEIWEKAWSARRKRVAINQQDLDGLLRMGEMLGYLDRDTQLNSLECSLLEIDNQIKKEEQAIDEKTRLYRWLGALAGIFICILMI